MIDRDLHNADHAITAAEMAEQYGTIPDDSRYYWIYYSDSVDDEQQERIVGTVDKGILRTVYGHVELSDMVDDIEMIT